jgi:hypothetical protein
MDFEVRRQADQGNLLFSYTVQEDHMASAVHGHEFLGVGRDDKGNEVHVFRMSPLNCQPQEADGRQPQQEPNKLPWKLEGHLNRSNGDAYSLWSRPHREGFTMYGLTHSDEVQPQGTGGYTSLEAITRKTGISIPAHLLPPGAAT